jgi:hypothetical protein
VATTVEEVDDLWLSALLKMHTNGPGSLHAASRCRGGEGDMMSAPSSDGSSPWGLRPPRCHQISPRRLSNLGQKERSGGERKVRIQMV